MVTVCYHLAMHVSIFTVVWMDEHFLRHSILLILLKNHPDGLNIVRRRRRRLVPWHVQHMVVFRSKVHQHYSSLVDYHEVVKHSTTHGRGRRRMNNGLKSFVEMCRKRD